MMEERIFRSSSNRELRRTTNAVEGSGIEPATSRTRSGNLTAGQKWGVFAHSTEFALAPHTRTFRDEHGDAFSPSSGRE